jgi:hypothetical protein
MNMNEYLVTDYLAGDVRVSPTADHRAETAVLAARLLANGSSSPETFEAEADSISRALIEPLSAAFLASKEGDEVASRIAALLEALVDLAQAQQARNPS